jgi:uncharacterized protein (DUF433 family)
MMTSKPFGKWQNSHVHRASGRRHAKLEGWPNSKIHCIAVGEQLRQKLISEYPDSTLGLLERAMRRCPSISMDVKIMQGQPCIVGTRIPVRSVLRALEQYGSVTEVRTCYPHLTVEQIEDALYFSQVILELPSGIDETSVVAG